MRRGCGLTGRSLGGDGSGSGSGGRWAISWADEIGMRMRMRMRIGKEIEKINEKGSAIVLRRKGFVEMEFELMGVTGALRFSWLFRAH